MKTEIQIGRVFLDRCLELHLEGKLDVETAAMAKYWLTELEGRVIDQCLQMHGGYGYMLEYPIARAFADARVHRIYGGSNEIMRELIARSMLMPRHDMTVSTGIISGSRKRGFDEVEQRVLLIAGGLQGLGVSEGDCVCILMRNDIAFLEASYAVMLLGAYAVPVNWHFKPEEVDYILEGYPNPRIDPATPIY